VRHTLGEPRDVRQLIEQRAGGCCGHVAVRSIRMERQRCRTRRSYAGYVAAMGHGCRGDEQRRRKAAKVRESGSDAVAGVVLARAKCGADRRSRVQAGRAVREEEDVMWPAPRRPFRGGPLAVPHGRE